MLRKIVTNRRVVLLFVIIVQIFVCLWMGHLKRGFFCDEIYSYGLANSEDYSFIDYGTSKEYGSDTGGWVNADYFKNYVEVDNKDRFSFSAAIRNQINDVHPPLYYMLLHAVCALFPNTFSKWTGIGLNLGIMLILDILLYYISLYFFEGDNKKAILTLVMWGFSAAAISNILFIRMYLLQTAEILLYIAIHIYVIQKNSKLNIWKICLLCGSVILGGLTHYYFYIFAFFFSAPICLLLLYKKKVIEFIKYAGSLMLGFGINLLVFPATLKHVFGRYRGREVIKNLVNREENVFLKYYFQWINNSIFGGRLKIFLLVIVLVALWKICSKYISIQMRRVSSNTFEIELKRNDKKLNFDYNIRISRATLAYILTSIAMLGFAFVSIVGSQIASNRYIYPIYPIVSLWIITALCYMLKNKKVVLGIVMVMCLSSVIIYGIDFQYSDYDKFYASARSIEGDDCLLYYGNEWLDVYTALPLKFVYDETYFFNADEVGSIAEILENRTSCDDVVVSFPDSMSEENANNILNGIIENTDFSSYEYVYRYYAKVYLLR